MTAPASRRADLVHAAHSPPIPHPTGGRVVGTYVHAYDPPSRASSAPPSRALYDPPARSRYHAHIPAMRPAQETLGEHRRPSATPIYDALYAEYRRLFRALPGDRSDEEDLGFTAFSAIGQPGQPRGLTSGGHGHTGGYPGPATAHGHAGGHGHPGGHGHTGGHPGGHTGGWEPAGRHHRGYLPALPPGQRDGRGHGY